ncbi:MAG TPA: DUF4340 domain-containing protein [Verrucomicrobiae bacterium]|nr:DUF4340 domain-containing protein [Verrucomicrobiae bacterium]
MNRKQLGILLVLVVVLGGAGLVIFNKQKQARSAGNSSLGKKLLADLPVDNVAQVRIHQGTNGVTLVMKDGTWRVDERNDYPANFSQLREFVIKASELQAVQSEEVGASQLARMQLATGSGTNAATVVEFKSAEGKALGTLLLGKMHMSARRGGSPMGGMDGGSWPDGRYVAVGPNPDSVALVSETFDQIEANPAQWVNKDFLRIEKPRTIEVVFPEATNSWKLVRASETGEWELANAKPEEKLDSSKSSGVTYPFSSASFNDVLSGEHVTTAGGDQPTLINIETFDGFAYALKVGGQTNDAYPLTVNVTANLPAQRSTAADEKPEDKERLDKEFKEQQARLQEKLKQEQGLANWTYLVSTWSVEPLLKPRGELLEIKTEAAGDPEGAGALPGANSESELPGAPAVEASGGHSH